MPLRLLLSSTPLNMNTSDIKAEISHIDDAKVDHYNGTDEEEPVHTVVMKSSLDRMSVFQAMRVYKRVVGVAMLAAFSASLDGYRESDNSSKADRAEINLNGSIIANKGFIRTMASEANKTKTMDSNRVSV